MLPLRVVYYGEDKPLPDQVQLRAGPLAMMFQQGDLKYVRLGDQEILRRVYVAVRDANWGTVPPAISNLSIQRSDSGFTLGYEADHKHAGIHFHWRGEINGQRDGSVSFSMKGQALSTFRCNRIGFCVLHPIVECAAKLCLVEKVDGTVERGVFPRYISPHQPFLDMRAISHEVAPGLMAEVRFSGEVFEMEDQRNWCDASYKTYCPPLRLPFPVEIKKGTPIVQSVRLSLIGELPVEVQSKKQDAVTLSVIDQQTTSLPTIGVGTASHSDSLSLREIGLIRRLNLAHLRADLDLSQEYFAVLQRATQEADSLGVNLELALMLSDAADLEIQRFVAHLRRLQPPICRWLIFHSKEKSTQARWISLARKYLASYDPGAKVVSGTDAYFAELNRGCPPVELLDGLCFSITPQVHAFDNDSLVENLAAQAGAIRSACHLAQGLPVLVSPVTLKPRYNPNATSQEDVLNQDELPPQVDLRQMSLFGAVWTLGSLKYVSQAGAASVTYYETTGWRGVMETERGSLLPTQFPSLPGCVFPLFHVLADVGEFSGGAVVHIYSDKPLQVDGLAVRRGDQTRIFIGNMRPEVSEVILKMSFLGQQLRVKYLDGTNTEGAMKFPEAFRAQPGEFLQINGNEVVLRLRPYAYVRVDARISQET
jgi:hypothetical protein